MKGRHIHKFFHWIIMTMLLTFPIVMVGISTFGKESQTIDVTETYEYETNEVNVVDDLVVGNIYEMEINDFTVFNNYLGVDLFSTNDLYMIINDYETTNINYSSRVRNSSNNETLLVYANGGNNSYYSYSIAKSLMNNYVKFYFTYISNSTFITNEINLISASDYLGEKNVDYVIHNEDYKQDVNNWITGFLNLPINAWYQSLMNVIGVGFTNSTVMNVIYVMPVYIIWVFIFDLVVDCFLVLIRLPHKLLNRLSGGENE